MSKEQTPITAEEFFIEWYGAEPKDLLIKFTPHSIYGIMEQYAQAKVLDLEQKVSKWYYKAKELEAERKDLYTEEEVKAKVLEALEREFSEVVIFDSGELTKGTDYFKTEVKPKYKL